MDILYYIGSGSHHNNQELRYSLRALQTHCQDIDNVWIVGNKPHFLNDKVKYLWVEDSGQWWQNAYNKIMAAINAGIGKKFLLMNDDFFMLKDFYASRYPYYHKGNIPDKALNKYQEVIINTKKVLQSLNKPTLHYGVHCPMRIEAQKFVQLAEFYQNENNPVSARCLYGNLFCSGTKIKDNKSSEIKNSVSKCFSSKEWVEQTLWQELAKMFPSPSRWEKE